MNRLAGQTSFWPRLFVRLLCQAFDVIDSTLGPVGPGSVNCDLIRSASSVLMWQQVQLPEQMRP